MRKKSFVTKDTLNNKKYDVVFNKKTGKAHLYDYNRFGFDFEFEIASSPMVRIKKISSNNPPSSTRLPDN